VGVKNGERLFLFQQGTENQGEGAVLQDVCMVSCVEGVAVAQHGSSGMA